MYLPKNWQQLRNWLKTDLGQYVLSQEAKILIKKLSIPFGGNILILGEPNFCSTSYYFYEQNKNVVQFVVHPMLEVDDQIHPTILINSRQDKLPIDSDSIDLVLLPHSLEMVVNPHELLRESYRVLRPEGKIVITGFSFFSVWSIWKLFAKLFCKAPWRNRFIPTTKLIDWLTLLGMEDFIVTRYCHTLPINSKTILNKLLFLENIGDALPFRTGNIYTVSGCKRVIALTPVFVSK